MTIGFIGNFLPAHSTEQDRKWSFEKLGHKVIPLQENEITPGQLIELMPRLNMLLYSHTHDPSYVIKDLIWVFNKYKEAGIPTVSVHLDRWLWLKRVEDVGKEATWFTEYIFMADASPEAVELYNKLGLNWFYLAPAVVERDCKLMKIPEYNGKRLFIYPEIVFIGSKRYHVEYPFRGKLVEYLKETYGNKFRHYGNDGYSVARGDKLNEIYASSKIAVGDSCFGGRPYYVSDRYFETRGRGGFLLHPHTEGIETNGVGHYTKENLLSLKTTIDYWLEHDEERELMRLKGFNHVKQNETYTNRAKEIIEVVGL